MLEKLLEKLNLQLVMIRNEEHDIAIEKARIDGQKDLIFILIDMVKSIQKEKSQNATT
jgi:molybdate-binding protein